MNVFTSYDMLRRPIGTLYQESFTYQVFTYLVYRFIERPIKRTARRIACSGHWSY